jgi:hypothetical protein
MVMTIRMPRQRETMCGSNDGTAQSADPCGNAHGGSENVIGEECGCGKQAGRRAKIEAGHCIGPATRGISGDRLAIGKVNDDQQSDDGRADGNDIANAEKAKRNQKAEGCFWAIGRRAESIETKDGDALGGTDLLGAFITGFDGLADNEVKYVHEGLASKVLFSQETQDLGNGGS